MSFVVFWLWIHIVIRCLLKGFKIYNLNYINLERFKALMIIGSFNIQHSNNCSHQSTRTKHNLSKTPTHPLSSIDVTVYLLLLLPLLSQWQLSVVPTWCSPFIKGLLIDIGTLFFSWMLSRQMLSSSWWRDAHVLMCLASFRAHIQC